MAWSSASVLALLVVCTCIVRSAAVGKTADCTLLLPDVEGYAACVYAVKQFVAEGEAVDAALKITGCGDRAGLSMWVLCASLDVPRTAAAWDSFIVRRDRICGTAGIGRGPKCMFNCPGTTYDHCEDYAAPNVLIGPLYRTLTVAEAIDITDEDFIVQRDKWTEIIVAEITSAVRRHFWLLLAAILTVPPFMSDFPMPWRTAAGIIAATVYLATGNFIQAGIAVTLSVLCMTRAATNPNNAICVGLGIVLILTLIVIDAADSLWVSTVAVVIWGVLLVSMIVAMLKRRLAVDTATYLGVLLMLLNGASGLHAIVLYRQSKDPFVALFWYGVSAAMPHGNPATPFCMMQAQNAANLMRAFVRWYGLPIGATLPLLFAFYLGAFVLFVGARALLGYQVTRRMRDVPLLSQIWRGFLLVWTDFWSAIELFNICIGQRPLRSLPFAILATVFKYYELLYAPDLFVVSILAGFLCYVSDYKPARGAKYMSYLGEVEAGEFRCLDSLPWIDFNQLNNIRRAVVRLVGTDGRRAVGTVMRVGNDLLMLTARHVVKIGSAMATGVEAAMSDSVSAVYGPDGAADPAVLVGITTTQSFDKSLPLEVETLSEHEVPSVRSLFLIHPEGMMNHIVQFAFKFPAGVIDCAVDLIRGDSGCPVFATLSSGAIRLAGVVSRGTTDGSPNIIASCVRTVDKHSGSGSEGVSPSKQRKTLNVTIADQADETRVKDALTDVGQLSVKLAEAGASDAEIANAIAVVEALCADGAITPEAKSEILRLLTNHTAIEFNAKRSGPAFVPGGFLAAPPTRAGVGVAIPPPAGRGEPPKRQRRGRGGGQQAAGARVPIAAEPNPAVGPA